MPMTTFSVLVQLDILVDARAPANVPDRHSSIDSHNNAAIPILLESGSIYCFSVFLLAITLTTACSDSDLYSVLLGIAYQAINIATTLAVVRVGLWHNVEDAVKRSFTQLTNPMLSK
ncbi:hypothetical protein K438DRAFT_1966499 [Mycena galopus ATCC 62051]|nr:hypothetical protein K438DRAFT_1966499 [Mycena galopus ATCC 62051]